MTVGSSNALRTQAECLCCYFAILLSPALAHNPDTSYLNLTVTEEAIEVRLSYDIVTLLAIVPGLDADDDKAVSKAELRAAEPTIRSYLEENVALEIDGRLAPLGNPLPFPWPGDLPDAIPQIDYHQVVFHFPFRLGRTPPADLAIVFDFFSDFGERHKVLSKLSYLEFRQEILFRLEEPDYLLDLAYIRDQQEVPEPTPSPSPPAATSHSPPKSELDFPFWIFIALPIALLLPQLLHRMSTRNTD